MRPISFILLTLMLAGCDRAPEAPTDVRSTEVVRAAEQKAAAERQQREQAEARLQEQEESTSRWQLASMVAVSAAAFALIIGASLGSRARRHADP